MNAREFNAAADRADAAAFKQCQAWIALTGGKRPRWLKACVIRALQRCWWNQGIVKILQELGGDWLTFTVAVAKEDEPFVYRMLKRKRDRRDWEDWGRMLEYGLDKAVRKHDRRLAQTIFYADECVTPDYIGPMIAREIESNRHREARMLAGFGYESAGGWLHITTRDRTQYLTRGRAYDCVERALFLYLVPEFTAIRLVDTGQPSTWRRVRPLRPMRIQCSRPPTDDEFSEIPRILPSLKEAIRNELAKRRAQPKP
ncbi:MAG: hypothetical protein PHE83_16670 [Opitutaceae bacterium]|nr:hypothetical protein [Opitutaceae bacterium]